jgi:YEATS domain-containing protein 4
MQLHFTPDARESEVTLYHRLKLYEEDGTPSNLKKPVVHETYEDIVFSEPHEDFYNRVSKHVAGLFCSLTAIRNAQDMVTGMICGA